MGIFSSYLYSVLTVGIFSFICEAISGISKGSSLKRVLSFVASLCIFVSVALPLLNILDGLSSKAESIDEFKKAYSEDVFYEQVAFELENRLSQNIYASLGIIPVTLSIDLSVNQSSIEIAHVTVGVFAEDIKQSSELYKHIKDVCGNGTEVTILETKNDSQN